jgi:hypothetical protein
MAIVKWSKHIPGLIVMLLSILFGWVVFLLAGYMRAR